MSKYSNMVQALARARDRGDVMKQRVEKVQEMIVAALARDIEKKGTVTTTGLKTEPYYYLPPPGTIVKFTNELSLRIHDESGDEPGVTFTFAMEYIMSAPMAPSYEVDQAVKVVVNARVGTSVIDAKTALEVAQAIVMSCEAALGLGGNVGSVRPTISADTWPSR